MSAGLLQRVRTWVSSPSGKALAAVGGLALAWRLGLVHWAVGELGAFVNEAVRLRKRRRRPAVIILVRHGESMVRGFGLAFLGKPRHGAGWHHSCSACVFVRMLCNWLCADPPGECGRQCVLQDGRPPHPIDREGAAASCRVRPQAPKAAGMCAVVSRRPLWWRRAMLCGAARHLCGCVGYRDVM